MFNLEDPVVLAAYVVLKYTAYAGWCALGTRIVPGAWRSWIAAGLCFGAVRLLMGLLFGVLILLAVGPIYQKSGGVGTYAMLYVPVRILEWSIMVFAMTRLSRRPIEKLPSPWKRESVQAWVLGGVLISCLADVPIFATIGFPIGRFLC